MKSAILAANSLKTETIEANGVEIIVSEIGAFDLIRISQECQDADGELDMQRFSLAMAACSVVDESGNQVFTLEEIGKITRTTLMRIIEVARRLNGVSGEEVKNSEAGQNDSLLSVSACSSE